MPPPRQFPELTAWQTGKPDLVVEMRGNRQVKAAAPDWWGNVESEVAVTEDRWIKAVEVKPVAGYRMVHHAVASIVDPDLEEDEQNFNFSDRGALSEYLDRKERRQLSGRHRNPAEGRVENPLEPPSALGR